MAKKVLLSRRYALSGQQKFAALSGDFNPLHIDPIKARRELFGGVVVHGMHCVLDALDFYAALLRKRGQKTFALKKLSALFINPAYLNQKIETRIIKETKGQTKLNAQSCGQLLLEINLRWAATTKRPPNKIASLPAAGRRLTPRELSLKEIAGRSGKINLYINSRLAKAEFPNLCACVSLGAIAEILCLTRLVGTECPGLQSLFSSFELEFHPDVNTAPSIEYKVTQADPRFSMIKIALKSKSISGTLGAFYRPPPQKQPDIARVKKSVGRREFINQRALIIGGSRGLGEITAKIISAGGGYPVITYNTGLEDARRLARRIKAAGLRCKVLQCSISSPQKAIIKLAKSGGTPSHLYYFATPKIPKNTGAYNKKLFKLLADFYVEGLLKAYKACRKNQRNKLSVFYPSTFLLYKKQSGFAEYCAAKSAGEALCKKLSRRDPGLSILIKRLPPLATDQTLSLLPAPKTEALQEMLKAVREMNKNNPKGSINQSPSPNHPR